METIREIEQYYSDLAGTTIKATILKHGVQIWYNKIWHYWKFDGERWHKQHNIWINKEFLKRWLS